MIAGAGSGKTRVLTYKIAYLVQRYEALEHYGFTFTNKAAREMIRNVSENWWEMTLPQHLYMGTFHSIFSRILRAEAEHIGFNNNFTIYDESDSRSLLKAIVKEMGLDDKTYKPAAVHHQISMAKNNLDELLKLTVTLPSWSRTSVPGCLQSVRFMWLMCSVAAGECDGL